MSQQYEHIARMLGGVPTEAAKEAVTAIVNAYPRLGVESVPPDAWGWIATGANPPKWSESVELRASITAVLSHLLTMNGQQRSVLLDVAHHITRTAANDPRLPESVVLPGDD